MSAAAPASAAFLETRFAQVLEDNQLQSPAYHWRSVCSACGNVLITGWSASASRQARISKKHSDDHHAKGSAKELPVQPIVHECKRCSRKTRSRPETSNLNRTFPRTQSVTAVVAAPGLDNLTTVPTKMNETAPVSANANSKRRAKARKQNGLQALLEKSKSDQEQKKGFGLDLMDLMKAS